MTYTNCLPIIFYLWCGNKSESG